MLHAPPTAYRKADRVAFFVEVLLGMKDPMIVRVFGERFLDACYGTRNVCFGDLIHLNRHDGGSYMSLGLRLLGLSASFWLVWQVALLGG